MNRKLSIYFFVILLILMAVKPSTHSELNTYFVQVLSLLFLFSIVTHVLYVSKFDKNFFRIDIIFLIGFFIVHFQWPLMFSVSGLVPDNFDRIWVNEFYVNYSLWLSVIGGVSWLFGFHFFKGKKLKTTNFYVISKWKNFTYFNWLLFILFLLTAGSDFLSGGVYKGSGGSSVGEGVAAYIQLLFSISIILLSLIVIYNAREKYNGNIVSWFLGLDKLYLSLILTYIILFFLIGDRGGPLSLIISLGFLISILVRPIKFIEFTSILIFGALLLTIIGLGRSQSSGIGIFSAGVENFELDSGYDFTLNLANSVRTLFKSVSEVPSNYDFFYGQLWLSSFLSPIPFAQSLFLKFSGLTNSDISSSHFITFLTFGNNPHSGEGTSLIADIYLNFGSIGVFSFMFLLGCFFKKIYSTLIHNLNFKWLLIGVFVASFTLTLSRAGFFVMYRPILWGFLIYFIISKKFVFR
ncbi:putative polysaccharide polymerase [Indibacter alkaliphilus LW1]|uniref:Polysaccharide polymerase n=1 Tax=Indibacter alkaliphilus (strain CCUG 57479 / KCTC 22604 / LW1) TaxID=1189612 RepID=S2D4K2_INDAL|nr:O-antigen polymerase [Indibacter alkaliphilus]EOZ93859.1 putative polysaccharide polymerase [Indibacter alkaliphilus LW1]